MAEALEAELAEIDAITTNADDVADDVADALKAGKDDLNGVAKRAYTAALKAVLAEAKKAVEAGEYSYDDAKTNAGAAAEKAAKEILKDTKVTVTVASTGTKADTHEVTLTLTLNKQTTTATVEVSCAKTCATHKVAE